MPKGYWIGNADITDMAELWRYRELNREVMTRYGAKFIVLHGTHEVPEGRVRGINTLVEFPSYQDALDCYNSPEYQEAVKVRHAVSEGGTMIIVEGYDGPQDF